VRISLDHIHIFSTDLSATVEFFQRMLDATLVWDEDAANVRTLRLKPNLRQRCAQSEECHEEEPASHRLTCLGRLAPGPDYKLYLSPEFVETEADFARLKARMMRVGDVKTFENFVVRVPESVDISRYNTVIVWCESFGQFITAAKYR